MMMMMVEEASRRAAALERGLVTLGREEGDARSASSLSLDFFFD
jgi:hypothetical protein